MCVFLFHYSFFFLKKVAALQKRILRLREKNARIVDMAKKKNQDQAYGQSVKVERTLRKYMEALSVINDTDRPMENMKHMQNAMPLLEQKVAKIEEALTTSKETTRMEISVSIL